MGIFWALEGTGGPIGGSGGDWRAHSLVGRGPEGPQGVAGGSGWPPGDSKWLILVKMPLSWGLG